MSFEPTADKLIPDLSSREELVLLARTLVEEGYDDHLAGHITIRQPDGTFLCTPWLLTWDELLPRHVLRIDGDGKVLEGDWPVPTGIPLHLELHRRRHVEVVLHHHPRFGILWADACRIPPIYDQSSALGGGTVVVVDEYEGGVSDQTEAARVAESVGHADIALLANHGVVVTGNSVRAVHQRSVGFEQRCRHSYLMQSFGGGQTLARDVAKRMGGKTGNEFHGFWEAMVRRYLRDHPEVLETRN
jgi:L-ribulose-5-phosphate 4-epimerase